MRPLFLTFAILAIASATGYPQKTIEIVSGSGVAIDGKIDEKEWQGATLFELTGGGTVFFKHDGEHLYVGVRGAKNGWSQLYLNDMSSTDVCVLHASAALGMSVYKVDKNGLWQPTNEFSWELRDRTLDNATLRKMDDYLAKNFWVANNNNMNNKNETEFKLKPRNSAQRAFRIALEYVTGDDKQFFPASLGDDTLRSKLASGYTPPDLKFKFAEWAMIKITNNGKTRAVTENRNKL